MFAFITAIASVGFAYYLFEMTGIWIVIGIVLMALPFYIMLNNFQLNDGEKFVFSIILGLTIFPALVYLTGFLISFKISIIMIFAILLILAFAAGKFKKKN